MQHPNYTTPEEVITRRGVSFYMCIVLCLVVFGGFAALMFALAEHEGSWGPNAFGIVALLLGCYCVVAYYRVTPIVRMSSDGITYKGRVYSWQDVSSVALTGSQPMRAIGGRPMEGTKISLSSGEEIILLMPLYSNLASVRRFLVDTQFLDRDVFGENKDEIMVYAQESVPRHETVIQASNTTVHWVRGNSMLNGFGLLTCMFVIVAVTGLIFGKDTRSVLWVLILSFGAGTAFTSFINYFGVSGSELIVRNIYRPWKRKKFLFGDVRQIVFAHQSGEHVLRIVFHDFSTKQFLAAGLRNKDWFALLGLLRSRGVDVVDEMNFEERVKW